MLPQLISFLFFPRQKLNKKLLAQRLAGKTILITGASFGIGESIACLLANSGATLLLTARTENKLTEIVQNIHAQGGKAYAYPMDLNNPDSIAQAMNTILQTHPRIDFFISNAGKSIRRSTVLSFNRLHDAERTMRINYLGPVQVLLLLLPVMQANNGGHIINVSSISAKIFPVPRWGFYHASKIAFDKWICSIAPEFRSQNIVFTNVYLPLVKTRMIEPTPQYRNAPVMTAESAASLIVNALLTSKIQVAPGWFIMAELCTVLFRRTANRLMSVVFNRTADTEAASGINHSNNC